MAFEDEVKDFLVMFLKFEYALKESCYVKRKNKNKVQPDWDKFIIELKDEKILNHVDVLYLMSEPPKTQKCDGNKKLFFQDRNKISNFQQALEASLTVRNNLVHGGKVNPLDVERDRRLLKAATIILNHALKNNLEVKSKFDDAFI